VQGNRHGRGRAGPGRAPRAGGGMLRPDPGRPGLGMELRAAVAEPFRRA